MLDWRKEEQKMEDRKMQDQLLGWKMQEQMNYAEYNMYNH